MSTLDELLAKAKDYVMTPAEKEAQRQSWARGEAGLDRKGERGSTYSMVPRREIDCAAEVEKEAYGRGDLTDGGSYWDLCNPRKGGWMQVASGAKFYPLDPRPEDVNVDDIAHALGMKCRFGGHCKFFYSVAEHSVRIARHVGTLEALLHDGAEAYSPFGDVPRPLKADLPWVHTIECGIEQAVAARFGLTWPWPAEVKAADNAILHDERLALMGNAPADWGLVGEPLGVVIEGWDPGLAKALFLREFRRLSA